MRIVNFNLWETLKSQTFQNVQIDLKINNRIFKKAARIDMLKFDFDDSFPLFQNEFGILRVGFLDLEYVTLTKISKEEKDLDKLKKSN